MVAWQQVEQEAPELAQQVRSRFERAKHCTMATLRADGSPRISGTEVQFAGGRLTVGSMAGAVKARDLLRDPRVALHSPTVDPPEDEPSAWPGEAKVSGKAVELADPPREDGSHLFAVDLDEVVLTRVSGDALLVTSWHPGRGCEERRRS